MIDPDYHDGDPPDRTSGKTLFLTVVIVVAVLVAMLFLVIKGSSG